MKIKCFLCEQEFEEGESFDMHYVDGDCFIDSDEKINKMFFMSKLLFKIHEIKQSWEEADIKEITPVITEFIQDLKSLLEIEK